MIIKENNIIGEIVAQDYRTASVFKKYGIDFCCQGNRSIHEACKAKNINQSLVITDLNDTKKATSDSSIDYKSWSLSLLVDYIEKKHHLYVENKTQEIKPYLDKICRMHGNRHPELLEITKLFNEAAKELAAHMKKEELILFPFIRKMVNTQQENSMLKAPHFSTVEHPIQIMLNEHNKEGERFRKIESLSNIYTPPIDACNTYQVAFALLKEFESDLHMHIHLENNILFPKAIELEKKIRNS